MAKHKNYAVAANQNNIKEKRLFLMFSARILVKCISIFLFIFLMLCSGIVYADEISQLSISETFDVTAGIYVEKVGDSIEFLSSVPQGAVVADGVYFDIPSNIKVELLCDGAAIQFQNKTTVSLAGYYIMKLLCQNEDGEIESGVFTFRISNPPTGKTAAPEYKYPKISCNADITADSETGMNKYTLPNYKAFYSSVDGYGQTVESAKFIIPRNLGYSLKINGNTVPLINNKIYTQGGSYSLKVYGYSYASTGGYETSYETVLNFDIPYEQESVLETYEVNDINIFSDNFREVTTQETTDMLSDSKQTNIDDVLSEIYFEDAGVYSESFSNGDVFYTNTPNDGIVGGNVYLDVPYNMIVEMTKDGVSTQFNNKEYINENGIYSLIITDYFDGNTSSARYSFKIQNGTPMSADILEIDNEDTSLRDIETDEDTFNYDEISGMFFYRIGDGYIYCSVPDGMISNEPVRISIPENFNCKLTRNDEEVQYSDEISDNGRYELNVNDENGNETIISFYVAEKYINIEQFIVPQGYTLFLEEFNDAENENDEENIQPEYFAESGQVYEFSSEGEYLIVLESSEGMPDLNIDLVIDRTAPEIIFDSLDKNMTSKENSISIVCDDENTQITLIQGKNEEIITLNSGKAEISGNGKYTIIAEDLAGNKSEYTFTLGKNGNFGFIIFIAVILMIIIIGILLIRKGIIKMPNLRLMKIISARKNSGINISTESENDSDWESGEETFESYSDWDSAMNKEDYDTDDWEDD